VAAKDIFQSAGGSRPRIPTLLWRVQCIRWR